MRQGNGNLSSDTRAGIIERSLEMFAEKGYDGVSVRDITEAVDLTPGAIYHYFSGKADLYDVVVRHAFQSVTERMVTLTEHGGTPRQRLEMFIKGYVDFIAMRTPFMRLVDRVIFEADEPLSDLAAEVVDGPHRAVAGILREIDPDAPAAEMAEHLIATIYGAAKLQPLRVHLTGVVGFDQPGRYAAILTEMTLRSLGSGGTTAGTRKQAPSLAQA